MKKRMLIALVVALALAATASVVSGQGTTVCHVPDDYPTIQAAVDATACDVIMVGPGNWFGAIVTRPVVIKGKEGAIINDGPNTHSFLRAGFLFPGAGAGNGATISGFTFVGVPQSEYVDDGQLDFPIFSRGADNVTINHNVMIDSLQATTNWHGSGWHIHHNSIDGLWTLCGGGIGIFIGSFDGTPANGNTVGFNSISAADVDPGCALYSTPGIGLMSDARRDSGGPVQNNRVVHNQVSVTGYYGTIPTGVGIELTDVVPEGALPTGNVASNKVGFNDVRGSTVGMAFNPPAVEGLNTIGRNLGDNRGDSENHPSIFR